NWRSETPSRSVSESTSPGSRISSTSKPSGVSPQEQRPVAPPPPTDPSGAPTILVVDDTPMNLSVLVRILEGSGYRILVARSGAAALDIARHTQPDVILLDVVMPEMGGFEVCRALKRDPRTCDAIVIFLSALDEVTDKVAGLELGAADYITKPFQAEEVLARVRAHIARKQLERELRDSRDKLALELRSAGEMQQLLLPRNLSANDGLTFSAYYRTSLHAGGDYYDVVALDTGAVPVFVADVSGHGARAAVVMAMMRTLLHSMGSSLADPARVMDGMNRHFSYLSGTTLFATALCAVIDPAAKRMRIACAGHPTPVLLRSGLTAAPLSCEGTLPLFMLEPREVPVSTHELRAGDRLVFYTDGVAERQTVSGEMFGVERLVGSLGRDPDRESEHLLSDLVHDVEMFADGCEPQDDQ